MLTAFRRLLRVLLACTLYYAGVLSLWRLFRRAILGRHEVCVFGLHRILTVEEYARSNSLRSMVVKVGTFYKLLEYVNRHFTVLPLQDFLNGGLDAHRATKPLCLITFDDGWRDNYKNAYPLLKRFRAPATIFAITGLVQSGETFWVERLIRAWKDPSRHALIGSRLSEMLGQERGARPIEETVECLKKMPALKRMDILSAFLSQGQESSSTDEICRLMTWNEAIQMSQDGVEFGSHTVTHPLLTFEDQATVERELTISKQALEEKLGRPAMAFAYPNGDWDERVREQVQRAGFACAFTTRRGWHQAGDGLFTIKRVLLSERKITGLTGRFSPAAFHFTLACWF